MKHYEQIKKDISELSSGLEMAGYIDGINLCAIMFCKANCPNEIYVTEDGGCKVSVIGMAEYLESECST